MTDDELRDKMLAFIETRDGDYFDEWYASPRDFAATVLSDFAEHLGIELVVPAYIPRKTRPQVDRQELLKALMPGIRELFDVEYKKMNEKLQQEWNQQT
jgi:hypothetical protein